MKNIKEIKKYICCPKCKHNLVIKREEMFCSKCSVIYPVKNGYLTMTGDKTPDIDLSIQKWDELYEKQYKSKKYVSEFKQYKRRYYYSVFRELNNTKKIDDIVYLEIGCGNFFLGQLIAEKCRLIIGVDFCPHALLIAKKMLDDKKIKNYILVQADILNLPIKSNTIDLIYGGGVIEHFIDTKKCLLELSRVTRRGGVSINTVPHLNLGSLTYRQAWGNIPNFPILKQIAEFIHINILGGKHMIFGYELSFLSSTIRKLHLVSGFKKVTTSRFEIEPELNFIPALFRKPFAYFAKSSPLLWPMIKVAAIK